MDAVWCNVTNQNYADGQRLAMGPVDNEAGACARHNNDIGSVEGTVTEGFKIAVANAFVSASFVPMKLRSIAGLPMDDFRKMSVELKKATRNSDSEAQGKIARDYLEKVFAKAQDSEEMLKRIEDAAGLQGYVATQSSVSTSPVATDSVNKAESRKRPLGDDPEIDPKPLDRAETSTVSETGVSQQDATGLDQQDVSIAEEPHLKIPNEDYIRSLNDPDLNKVLEDNFNYDMDMGSFTYDTAMAYRYNRQSDQADFAMRRHPGSRASQNGYGIVTEHSTIHRSFVQEVLRTGSEKGCAPFCNGDTLVILTYQQSDKHAANMSFLLKSLDLAIHSYGLPEGLQELAIKVAVTDGYHASHVLRVTRARKGYVSSMESDPANLVSADNLLRITFNRKSDMAELFALDHWHIYKATGKTLGELERNNQVTLTLESTCNEAIQGTILTQCRGLPVLSDAQFTNAPQKFAAKTYMYDDMAFKGPYGGK